jgi:hypothetical protein
MVLEHYCIVIGWGDTFMAPFTREPVAHPASQFVCVRSPVQSMPSAVMMRLLELAYVDVCSSAGGSWIRDHLIVVALRP